MNSLVAKSAIEIVRVIKVSEVYADDVQKHKYTADDSTDPPENVQIFFFFRSRLLGVVSSQCFERMLVSIVEDVGAQLVHAKNTEPLLPLDLFGLNLPIELLAV